MPQIPFRGILMEDDRQIRYSSRDTWVRAAAVSMSRIFPVSAELGTPKQRALEERAQEINGGQNEWDRMCVGIDEIGSRRSTKKPRKTHQAASKCEWGANRATRTSVHLCMHEGLLRDPLTSAGGIFAFFALIVPWSAVAVAVARVCCWHFGVRSAAVPFPLRGC